MLNWSIDHVQQLQMIPNKKDLKKNLRKAEKAQLNWAFFMTIIYFPLE